MAGLEDFPDNIVAGDVFAVDGDDDVSKRMVRAEGFSPLLAVRC